MAKPNRYTKQLLSTNKYLVRIAENEKEVRQAQSLRYEVFNVEMDEGLDRSKQNELDEDKYDRQCHHLLVIVRSTDEIIGTYRMQTYKMAKSKNGFYAEDQYQTSSLPKAILDKSVEVGRACIAKEHRNGRVLFLLWRGIAEYMKTTGSRYLFGCCSLNSKDPKRARQTEQYLLNQDHLHPEYCVETSEEYQCPEVDISEDEEQDIKLPQLFRLYLNVGAKVISKPAIDHDFGTTDFLILVDVQELDSRSKALFME